MVANNAILITEEGYLHLQAELDHLWRIDRPEITRSVSEAAAQGDRSENAEYIYGKKRLREIDRRIFFLRKRLGLVQVVRQKPADILKVFFAAWVEVREINTASCFSFRIVGPDEIDLERNWISYQSPMARALIGKRLGDAVWVKRPAGTDCFCITAVSYQNELGASVQNDQR